MIKTSKTTFIGLLLLFSLYATGQTITIKGNTSQSNVPEYTFLTGPYEIKLSFDDRAVFIVQGQVVQIYDIVSYKQSGRKRYNIRIGEPKMGKIDIYHKLMPKISRNSIVNYVTMIKKMYNENELKENIIFDINEVTVDTEFWQFDWEMEESYYCKTEKIQYAGFTHYPYDNIKSAIDEERLKEHKSDSIYLAGIDEFLLYLHTKSKEETTVSKQTQELDWKSRLSEVMASNSQVFARGGRSKTGVFSSDSTKGFKIYRWPEGGLQFGETLNNKYHGKGVFIPSAVNTDGVAKGWAYFSGEFENGQPKRGTVYDDQGDHLAQVIYKQGKVVQRFKMSMPSLKFQIIRYKDDPEGRDFYIGETTDGKRHGTGMLVWKNNDIWIGEWVGDRQYGEGIYFHSAGNYTIGK